MKDASQSHKKRYVLQHGRIFQDEDKEWVFIAHPAKDCIVSFCRDKSQWSVVDTVYDMLHGYGYLSKNEQLNQIA